MTGLGAGSGVGEQFLLLFEPIKSVAPYNGSYEYWLVATSVSIAILAAFVALSISSRMANAPSWQFRWAWAGAGALSMGGGIWAMHFIGVLAFSLPCGVSYDPLGTLLSMIPGVIASGVALHVISRVSAPGPARLLVGAVLIGAGIGAMHYSGMAAMRPDATIRYQPGLVAVSVVVAVVLAFVALEARFQLRRFLSSDTTATLVAAIFLGRAVSGMHYTAMQASVFYPLSRLHEVETIMPPPLLAALITVISVLIAAIALVSSADVPSRVIGDPVRLRQVLVNLVGNAVKFTEAGEVVVKVTALRCGPDEVVLSFTVEDTGIGITADQCTRIFESFHQVDGSMTRAQGGSGLGLAISRQLVELMGGSVSLESELGRGSCFGFTARFNAAPYAAEQPHPRQHLPRSLRALVIDGNAASADVISLYLANWQIDARVVHTVSEAEDALYGDTSASSFDVAIIDVKSLGPQALEWLRSVRGASGARPIELVLLVSLDTWATPALRQLVRQPLCQNPCVHLNCSMPSCRSRVTI